MTTRYEYQIIAPPGSTSTSVIANNASGRHVVCRCDRLLVQLSDKLRAPFVRCNRLSGGECSPFCLAVWKQSLQQYGSRQILLRCPRIMTVGIPAHRKILHRGATFDNGSIDWGLSYGCNPSAPPLCQRDRRKHDLQRSLMEAVDTSSFTE
jgi:hypothetical protein